MADTNLGTLQIEPTQEMKDLLAALRGDISALETRLREIVREEIEAHEQRQKVRRFARGGVK